ncbi:polyphosphate polymerase domain-containing protein [Clostridium culturomicium]|uniref:polyphosphate polymerase domain-containing protein n=1 Tax=Clostridium culturomicium TaxID=1499683 RepID=UPI0038573D14
MKYQNVFKRYELKYLITRDQQKLLLRVMNDYMEPDQFGRSTICNIYFDTPNKILIRRSNEKPLYKEKLRIRSYGIATSETTVFVELKKKYNSVVYKRRISLVEAEAMNYLIDGIHPPIEGQITKEIDYFLKFYQSLEPSLFMSYERKAFFSKNDSNFRMTFDENILCRDYDLNLKAGTYGSSLLADDMVLLEIKTSMGIPLWLTNFLSENKLYKTSFSKYGNAYKTLILPKLLGGIKVA